jgi:hypothetical protein
MTRVQGNDSRWDAWAKQASSTGRPPAPQPKQAKTTTGGGKTSKAAATRLKRKSRSDDRLLDRLASVYKRHGRLPENFLRSAEGKAALRLLGRRSDGAVASLLRKRGLSSKQVQKVREDLFVHLQRQVGRSICDAIKDARTMVARMVRDPAVRKGFSGYLSGLKDAASRSKALKSLGVEARTAESLARSRRCSDSALLGALKTADADLQRLWTQATMTKQDPVRAAGTFELFGKVADKVRRDLGLPARNGSFGSKALDAGVAAAHKSKSNLQTYGKLSSIAASVIATVVTGGAYGVGYAVGVGAASSATTSATTGLPGLAKARHKRKLAEAGEALGLTKRGAAEKARRKERSTQKQYAAGTALSAGAGAGGGAAGEAAKSLAPVVGGAIAGGSEAVNQYGLPKVVK